MATQEQYDNSAGEFITYEVSCQNLECSSYDLEYGNVRAETIYPYIFCGSCGNQILKLKAEGKEWTFIEEAFSYFSKLN
jgi:hypothetical protein